MASKNPASPGPEKVVVAGALGECVHVAGVMNFLRLAEEAGWKTVFLGPAAPVERFISAAQEHNAALVGVSYRLTPETGERLLGNFAEAADELHAKGVRFFFGGTPPVAEKARKLGFFEEVFDGSMSSDSVLTRLKSEFTPGQVKPVPPQRTMDRIRWKTPYPLLRHHFGLPTLETTITGIARIAEAGTLDVISLGVDQDAQANFFHPERQTRRARGAGGVPVRSAEDYAALYQASRTGNYPMLRTYSGTDDFLELAAMYIDTIRIAWAAIPLFWFNRMDGRGPWDLEGSIREHQKVLRFYGERDIPVELNEPHHWGMRDAPDVLFVVSAYLSALNARAFGVRDYIAQFMFNSPPGLSDAMDLAKMLACLNIIKPLENDTFHIWRQTRTGLLSFPLNMEAARGHLAASTYLQMALKPNIVHIVGFSEADHAATPDEVIAAGNLVQRVIENALRGSPNLLADPALQERAEELTAEAQVTLQAIRELAPLVSTVPTEEADIDPADQPLINPAVLSAAVTRGILDAPHLVNNPYARGKIHTTCDGRGACLAVNPDSGETWCEAERIASLETTQTT
ncbi:MAG: cobalamin B12-binding domain-containing protein [Anaerolineales bacterium]|nr:cobalamin B12-binding domain-containing protein [Anaerolineales bacterium]